jgi:formylglycine-generating enzyme required for sulfatase activity/tRNA A-37 threonylcarbamoyl transferase component Bud32
MNHSTCPAKEQLRDYILGNLSEDVAEQTERHLQACRACELTAESLETEVDSLIEQIREPLSNDHYLAEPQCQVAVARAKLLVEKAASEEGQPQDLAPSQPADLGRLGEYQLLAKLGMGGMGAVYKARQTRLKKIVALKVLPKERMTDPRAVTRFEREMEAVGQLAHPNIVQAYDAREIQGTSVLVMEYVDGKDLAQMVECLGRLPISDACEVVRQTALGLQYAHEHGLIHRDIKPSNLMLTILPSPVLGRGEGVVKILDLGLALLGTDQPAGGELTSAGQAVGTADYMAPEQVSDAHSVDSRADIYALGCTLYKVLTGSPPFSGPQYKTAAEKLVGHLKETPPPVQRLRSEVSAELAAVIERMMAKSPTDRFATLAEVAAAIAPFAAGCDLAGVSAQASAAAGGAVAGNQSPSATEPSAASAVVDTDATGLQVKAKTGERPAPAAESAETQAYPRFRKPRRLRIALAAAALSAVVLLGVLIVIKLRTSEGTLVVEVDDPAATVQVLNEKKEVVIQRPGEKGSVTIGAAPGKGRLRLVKDGVVLFARDFSLVSGGTGTIDARLEKPHGQEPVATPVARDEGADDKQARERQAACARQLGVPVEITNSIGMKLALIPSGEFKMGSPAALIDVELRLHGYNEMWRNLLPGELPQHRVRITRPYRLGVTEVTQEQYQRVMGSNPSKFQGDPHRPVEQVSWDDAVEFCSKLSELPGERAVERRYGLPTEAQWEYACRAGSMAPLQSKADPSARLEEEKMLRDYAWFGANSDGQTHPVGQKRANALGLSDMYGNAAEWCADWIQPDYYAKSPVDDPSGPRTGTHRVVRGGSFLDPPYGCRLTARCTGPPGLRDPNVGFRVAQFPADK